MKNEQTELLYFHGSPKSNAEAILRDGLRTSYGRTTFSTTPHYALYYGEGSRHSFSDENIGTTVMFVFANADGAIKPTEMTAKFDYKLKKVTGYPNKYASGSQYAYYPENKPKGQNDFIFVDPSDIVAGYRFNQDAAKAITVLRDETRNFELDEPKVSRWIEKFITILSDPNLEVVTPKLPVSRIARAMVCGVIHCALMQRLRRSELRLLVEEGWEITNSGNGEIHLERSKEKALEVIGSIGRIIDQSYIHPNLRDEYKKFTTENEK